MLIFSSLFACSFQVCFSHMQFAIKLDMDIYHDYIQPPAYLLILQFTKIFRMFCIWSVIFQLQICTENTAAWAEREMRGVSEVNRKWKQQKNSSNNFILYIQIENKYFN